MIFNRFCFLLIDFVVVYLFVYLFVCLFVLVALNNSVGESFAFMGDNAVNVADGKSGK